MLNPSLVNIFSNYLYSSGLNHDVLTTIIGRFPASAISTIYACATRLSMVEYHEEYFTNTTNDYPQCLGISEPDAAEFFWRDCAFQTRPVMTSILKKSSISGLKGLANSPTAPGR